MSDYKRSVIKNFGTGAIEFCLDDLELKEGETLPEWLQGKKFHVLKLSGDEVEDIAGEWARLKDKEGEEADLTDERFKGLRARFVARCQCDPEGNKLWDSDDECNKALSYEFLNAAFLACQQVNGLNTKAREDAEKNSLTTSD